MYNIYSYDHKWYFTLTLEDTTVLSDKTCQKICILHQSCQKFVVQLHNRGPHTTPRVPRDGLNMDATHKSVLAPKIKQDSDKSNFATFVVKSKWIHYIGRCRTVCKLISGH